MLTILKLPFHFDPAALQADLATIAADEWVPHFNTATYQGSWSGVALRSVGGKPTQLYPDPTAQDQFADTEVLERCPTFRTVLATLECPLLSARLLHLDPRSNILEHRDYRLGYEDGEVRLHIPVVTHPDVTFFLQGQPIPMQVGDCWYLNLNLPHHVENQSDVARVHLVVDCVVNEWLTDLFTTTAA
jgi:hypothetical protein